jgi:hypothetical protein
MIEFVSMSFVFDFGENFLTNSPSSFFFIPIQVLPLLSAIGAIQGPPIQLFPKIVLFSLLKNETTDWGLFATRLIHKQFITHLTRRKGVVSKLEYFTLMAKKVTLYLVESL